MRLADLIGRDAVIDALKAADKVKAIEALAARAEAVAGVPAATLAAAVLHRERLGSTGIGRGCALPHARFPALERPAALFARLREPIDWAAIDDRPVDLVCLLVLPAEGDGALAALAAVSRRLREEGVLARLRRARDADALLAALLDDAGPPP